MHETTGVGAFSFKCIQWKLDCMCINFVEDTIGSITDEYFALARQPEEKFMCKGKQYDNFNVVGAHIKKKDSEYRVNQISDKATR